VNYYGFDGQPISQDEWLRLFNDIGERRVAYDELGPYIVSTVWLGLDHSFGHGPPLIWETIVMDAEGNASEMLRSATRDRAVENHAEMLERYSVFGRSEEWAHEDT
jgi:hypothetical protein